MNIKKFSVRYTELTIYIKMFHFIFRKYRAYSLLGREMEIPQGKERERAMVLQHRELPTAKLNSMKQNPAMGKKQKRCTATGSLREGTDF